MLNYKLWYSSTFGKFSVTERKNIHRAEDYNPYSNIQTLLNIFVDFHTHVMVLKNKLYAQIINIIYTARCYDA